MVGGDGGSWGQVHLTICSEIHFIGALTVGKARVILLLRIATLCHAWCPDPHRTEDLAQLVRRLWPPSLPL